MNLSEKQKRFADFYISLGDGTEAYLKAGYKVKSRAVAKVNASRLLTNANLKAYINDGLKKLQSERIANQQEIMEFLTDVMRGKVTEPVLVLDGEGTQRIEYLKPSINSRKSAAEQLGKRYAMWTDKQQVDVNGAVRIVDDVPVGGDSNGNG